MGKTLHYEHFLSLFPSNLPWHWLFSITTVLHHIHIIVLVIFLFYYSGMHLDEIQQLNCKLCRGGVSPPLIVFHPTENRYNQEIINTQEIYQVNDKDRIWYRIYARNDQVLFVKKVT